MTRNYSLDAIKFINEIKKHRQLWDSSDNGFKTRNKASEGGPWKDVAKAFIPNLDRLKEVERVEIYRKLYKKWRNMKDSHIRMLRRKKTPYVYAKHLSFINSQYHFDSERPHGEERSSDDDTSRDDRTFCINVSKTINFGTANYNSCTSDEDSMSTIKDQNSKRPTCNKRIEFVDTPMSPQGSNSFPVPGNVDQDRAFFDSLLPAVREFSIEQKLEFRCEMLQLIKIIRFDATNYSKSESVSESFEVDTFLLK